MLQGQFPQTFSLLKDNPQIMLSNNMTNWQTDGQMQKKYLPSHFYNTLLWIILELVWFFSCSTVEGSANFRMIPFWDTVWPNTMCNMSLVCFNRYSNTFWSTRTNNLCYSFPNIRALGREESSLGNHGEAEQYPGIQQKENKRLKEIKSNKGIKKAREK